MPPKKQTDGSAGKAVAPRKSLRAPAGPPDRATYAAKGAAKENVALKSAPKKETTSSKTVTKKRIYKAVAQPTNNADDEAEETKGADSPPPKKRARKSVEPTKPGREATPFLPPNAANALPTEPPHTRPAPQLFVWGAGNFGQFGMGAQHLGEFEKPKKNTWVDMGIEEGKFGGEGAGIEAVAAGGLHTMFIDEKGHVSILNFNMRTAVTNSSDLDLRRQ